MVEELKDQNQPGQVQPGRRGPQSDRWGDPSLYATMPVKKMIALYDYDPHELSPNVDAVRYLCVLIFRIFLNVGTLVCV